MSRMTILVLSASLSLMGASAEARDCRPLYRAMGPLTQPSQGDAERMARQTWRTQVAHKYGSDYADWGKAKSRKVECEEIAKYFRCWAEAKPCR